MAENEVYSVVTVLTLEDRMTPAMRRAAAVARELYSEIGRLKDVLADLGAAGAGGVSKVSADLAELNAGLAGTARNATLLGDELKALQFTPGFFAGIDRLVRSVGTAEKRALSLRGVLSGLKMPHLGMNVPTALGAAVGYGVYREAEIQHFVNRVMLAANESVLGPDLMLNPMSQKVRNVIRDTSSSTGMSATDAGEALMPVVLQMGAMPLDKRLDIAPLFEKFAFIESQLKGVDPKEASSSLVGLLHMTGSYDPEAMKKLAASVAFVSTISPMGLPAIERTASYVMPSALTAGIDPSQLLLVLAQAQSAGVSSTKAGTWFNDLFLSLSPKGGFASLISSKAGKTRLHAMEELGLVKNGKNVGLDMLHQGKWTEFSKMLAAAIAKVPEDKRLGLLSEATGSIQAARALNLMAQPSFTQNLPELQEQQAKFLSGGLDEVIKKLGEGDPTIEFRKVMADFTNALMDLGKIVLPPLTAVLRSLDDTLKKLVPSLPGANGQSFNAGDIAKTTAVATAAGAKVGGPIGALVAGGSTAAAMGGYATGQYGVKHGVYIDPASGASWPLNPPSPNATAGSGGFGKLGDLLDEIKFDWSKLNPLNWFISSAHADELPGGVAALANRAGMAPLVPTPPKLADLGATPPVRANEAATARPGTGLDLGVLKTLAGDLSALLGAAKLKPAAPVPGATAHAGTAFDPNVLKALNLNLDALGMKAGGAGAKAKEAVAGLDAFSAAIGRLQMAVTRGVKAIGDAAARLPGAPGTPGRQSSATDPGHAHVVAAIDRLGSKLPVKVVMDGRVVGQLVGNRLDREAAKWPNDRDNFDPGQMPPSAGSGGYYSA